MLDSDDFGAPLLVIRSDADHRREDEVGWEWRAARSPYDDEYVSAFVVCARTAVLRVEQAVRTFGGDGLPEFLDGLAEDFAGWTGARVWESNDRALTVSAEHHGLVRLRWGVARWDYSDVPGRRDWFFEAETVHAAGESMRVLAREIRAFLEGDDRAPNRT